MMVLLETRRNCSINGMHHFAQSSKELSEFGKRNGEFLITCLAMTSRPKIELCMQQWFFTILSGFTKFQMLILKIEIVVVKHNKDDGLKKKSLVDLKKKK
ncbi:unnamed protein product [Brassica rapa subsp. trilocularis]